MRVLMKDYAARNYECLWRKEFLDSARVEIRKMGIIADIDIWNLAANAPERFIEVKAQKVAGPKARPIFHLSSGEWRSYLKAKNKRISYEVWLFQYRDVEDFKRSPQKVTLTRFVELSKDWLDPEGYLVLPPSVAGIRRRLMKSSKS